jgi:hypothetical protein
MCKSAESKTFSVWKSPMHSLPENFTDSKGIEGALFSSWENLSVQRFELL